MKKLILRTPSKSVAAAQRRRTRDVRASLVRHILTIGVGFMLALFSAALTYSAPPAMDESFGAAVFLLQSTSTPQPKGISEIGSTDGIVIMGFLIALIVIIPILWHRKAWMEPR